VVASAICFLVYFWLLQRLSAVVMSFIFVIFPVLAQLLAVPLEGASLTWTGFLLSLVIMAAFAWTLLGQRSPAPAGPASGDADDTGEAVDTGPVDISGAVPTPEHLQVMYAAAARAYPQEACGLVRASGVQECVNAIDDLRRVRGDDYSRTAETGYAFGARDLLALNRSFDSDDPVLVVFHSHPDAGAYMSDEDQRHAVLDGQPTYPVDHVVVDATAAGVRGARKFRFDSVTGTYVQSAVYGSPHPADGLPPVRSLVASPSAGEGR
jgi:proteasome lid subunit RPN8/RPN11